MKFLERTKQQEQTIIYYESYQIEVLQTSGRAGYFQLPGFTRRYSC